MYTYLFFKRSLNYYMELQKLHPHTATTILYNYYYIIQLLHYTTTTLYDYYIMLKIFTRLSDGQE